MLFLLLGLLFFAPVACAGYGDPINGHPSWIERGVLVLTNACRTDPAGFRDLYVGNYQILLPGNYPAVNPLAWNYDLNRAALFHAEDMAANCGMQHNSCNGDSFYTRIYSYYTKSYTVAENIATGQESPLEVIQSWLMDGDPPAADKSGYDGHRRNIMNANYHECGIGYAYTATRQWYHFWTQDFGGGSLEYYPIIAGAHVYLNGSATTFMVNYWDTSGTAPVALAVQVDDVAHGLSLVAGTVSRGTYALTLPKAQACRRYYFTGETGRNLQLRYPSDSLLYTYGEGTCAPISVEERAQVLVRGPAIDAYPNPCTGAAAITSTSARVSIFDSRGRLVRVLVSGSVWDATGMPAGVYVIMAQEGGETASKRIVLFR